METKEYHTVDKSAWGDGPWQQEPDKKQWQDPTTGLPCLIVRNPHLGNLCGYVGVPRGHPSYGLTEHDIDNVDVHGGLTFANSCNDDPQDQSVCHVPTAGEPDDMWWLGFDCGHFGDVMPGWASYAGREIPRPGEYRDFAYVSAECARLARQLA